MTREPELIEVKDVSNNKIKKQEPNTLYENLLSNLKEKIGVIEIRISTIHLLIKYVMEQIEDTPIKGLEQKELALKLMRELIIDFTEHEDEKVLLDLLDNGTMGNLIDLISDATKGKLNINSIINVSKGCISSCIPYCSSKNKSKKK